jgi:hypothetical protein
VQNDIDTTRRFADRGVVERVEFHDLGTGRCKPRAARPHQARDRPAAVAERLRCRVSESTGGAEHQDAPAHDRRPAKRTAICVVAANDEAMLRGPLIISNAANLMAAGN